MSRVEVESLVDALNARYAGRERRQEIGAQGGGRPRFELYHFFMSMCSYKLRTVLDEKQAAYVSHDIDIFPPDIMNYYPEYVRLRLKGGEAMIDRFVRGYTGRSSTETEGFDPCVVPTLVDHEAGRVHVNSKHMCMYLDAEIEGGAKLIPGDLEDQIVRQIDIVDRTPHVAVLYGVHPDDDRRPAFVRRDMVGVHDRKIAKLRENMALAGDDPVLVSAYEHKIMKEAAAKAFVRTEQDMRAAIQEFKVLIGRLEEDLAATGDEWLFGNRFTLADVFWAVSLFRVRWLGLGYIIDSGRGERRYPRVAAYCERLLARPSVRRAVIDWPMHPPSEHLPELYPRAQQR
jgi:2,5-dichlorohydroquinone reductive dechlorinase